jgi:hypothetical protein
VSQFAAGCALCGADLVEARRAAASRRTPPVIARPRLPAASQGRAADILFAAVLALLALFAPPFGLLLGGYMAYRFDREGRTSMRNLAAACALASLLFVLFPFGIYANVLDLID